jgi:polyphosphate kinase
MAPDDSTLLSRKAKKRPPLELDEAMLASPGRFINRELSWLEFNRRVLEESENPRHPLLERLRFLSISANNLDEFYMVRVAGLKGQVREGVVKLSQDGLTPAEQLERINTSANDLMVTQQARWLDLKAELAGEGIQIVYGRDLDKEDRVWLRQQFLDKLFPVLTPLAIDPAHPFPFIPNLGFALALKLRRHKDKRTLYALVPIPTQVERFWTLPPQDPKAGNAQKVRRIIPLESVLAQFLDHLFPGMEVEARGGFRVIRDSDVEMEEEAEDLVREFEALLKQRRLGDIVRIKIDAAMPPDLRGFIVEHMAAEPQDVVVVDGMLGLAQLSELIGSTAPTSSSSRTSRATRADPRPRRRRVRRHPGEGHPGPPPVRELRRGGPVPAPGGARTRTSSPSSRRSTDLQGQPDRGGADRGGGERQERHRAGRDQGALRRGGEPALGAGHGARRRPRRLRLRGVQDPRQDQHRGPA